MEANNGRESERFELEKARTAALGEVLNELKATPVKIANETKKTNAAFSKPTKNLELKSFGSKLGNIFTSAGKRISETVTRPFANIGAKISGAFSGVKNMFSNLNPFKAIGKIKDKVGAAKEKIKKMTGRDAESLRKKFFENWWNPNKVFAIQWGMNKKLWDNQAKIRAKKEGKKNSAIPFIVGPSNEEVKMRFYRVWNKPGNVAKVFALEFEKMNKKNATKKVSGPEASMGQVYGKIAVAVEKIADAVTFFFSGPGLGIALAIGLTPPILLLGAAIVLAAWLVANTLEKIATPITLEITATLKLLRGIFEKILAVFDSPLSAVAKGVSAMGKGSSPKSELGTIFSMAHQVVDDFKSNYLTPIKTDVATIAENSLKGDNSAAIINKLSSIEGMLSVYFANASQSHEAFNLSVFVDIFEGIKSSFEKATFSAVNVFNKILSKMEDMWNIASMITSDRPGTQVTTTDSFTKLTKSFNTMQSETNSILKEIKTAIIDMSKNRIKIDTIEKPGTATATDFQGSTQPLNVVVNDSNQKQIQDLVKSIDDSVKKIVNNTSLKDDGTHKDNASFWELPS